MKPLLLAALAALTLAGCTPKTTEPGGSQVTVRLVEYGATGCTPQCTVTVTNTGGPLFHVRLNATTCEGQSIASATVGDMPAGAVRTLSLSASPAPGCISQSSCTGAWSFTVLHD